MSARADILNKIGNALDRSSDLETRQKSTADRIANPQENLIPSRGQVTENELPDLFREWAEFVSASTDRVEKLVDVPAALAAYLKSQNLPSEAKIGEDELLDQVDWSQQPTLNLSKGVTDGSDQVGLAVAYAGVAETGTLVLHAAPENPTSNNFLPETHVVLLPRSCLMGDYEATWDKLRKDRKENMPRVVNWITGPSRTGDIEQQIQLGIHGPRRLHIIIVDEA